MIGSVLLAANAPNTPVARKLVNHSDFPRGSVISAEWPRYGRHFRATYRLKGRVPPRLREAPKRNRLLPVVPKNDQQVTNDAA